MLSLFDPGTSLLFSYFFFSFRNGYSLRIKYFGDVLEPVHSYSSCGRYPGAAATEIFIASKEPMAD